MDWVSLLVVLATVALMFGLRWLVCKIMGVNPWEF